MNFDLDFDIDKKKRKDIKAKVSKNNSFWFKNIDMFNLILNTNIYIKYRYLFDIINYN